MNRLRTGVLAWRELGPAALLEYLGYRLGLTSGAIRRATPRQPWPEPPLAGRLAPGYPLAPARYLERRRRTDAPPFFFRPSSGVPWPEAGPAPPELVDEADGICAGRFRLFGGEPVDLGYPPDWHAFPPPLSDLPGLKDEAHWSRLTLDRPGADVRLLWELSRFGWVFPLSIAFRWSGVERYADAAWNLIDAWRRGNPPNHGVHWASAQEAGLRLMALTWAFHAFLPAWEAAPERLAAVAAMVAVHAERIPPTLRYARAQGNNHLLSEGAGLLTAGLAFPEFKASAAWRRLGRRALERGFVRQVYADGGYVQHSATYHRMALGLGVWTARLAEIHGAPLSRSALEALGRLTRGLDAQADADSGLLPAFGPDDGSRVLPISSGGSDDVRPELEAAARLFLGESWFGDGAGELSAWLGLGPAATTRPAKPISLPQAGVHLLTGDTTRGRFRCVHFSGRPGHSDQLHVDLWFGELPVALDPGSYLYNGPPPFDGGMAGAGVHNTPRLDGLEPMRRAGRFLWLDRAQGRLTHRWADGSVRALRGEHDGYRRRATMRRTLALVDGAAWLVVDQAIGSGEARLNVGWNLPDIGWTWERGALVLDLAPQAVRVEFDAARAGLARAGAWVAGDRIDGPIERWGWRAPRYGSIVPCLRVEVEATGRLPLVIRTGFGREGHWPPMLARLWAEDSLLEPPGEETG